MCNMNHLALYSKNVVVQILISILSGKLRYAYKYKVFHAVPHASTPHQDLPW